MGPCSWHCFCFVPCADPSTPPPTWQTGKVEGPGNACRTGISRMKGPTSSLDAGSVCPHPLLRAQGGMSGTEDVFQILHTPWASPAPSPPTVIVSGMQSPDVGLGGELARPQPGSRPGASTCQIVCLLSVTELRNWAQAQSWSGSTRATSRPGCP